MKKKVNKPAAKKTPAKAKAIKKRLPLLPPLPPCDFSEAMERVGGNLPLLSQVYAIFLEEIPKMVHAMRGFAKKKNYPGLWNEAHKMKGASSHFGAAEMMAILLRIETATQGKKGKNFSPLFQHLTQAISRFKGASEKWDIPPGGGVVV